MSVLNDGVVKMSVETFLHICNIFNLSDPTHRYLLPLFLITDRGTHGGEIVLISETLVQ